MDVVKKRISIFLQVLTIGGIEKVSVNLAQNLAKLGFDVALVVSEQKREQGKELLKIPEEIKVFKFDTPREAKDFIVKEFKPHININQLYWKAGAFWVEGWGDIKQILCVHSDIFSRFVFMIFFFLKNWNKYQVVTFLTKENTKKFSYFLNNINYLPNFIETKEVEQSKLNSKNILFIGRFNDEVKNPIKILRIFSETLKKEQDAKLTIVGPYNLELIDKEYGVSVRHELNRLALKEQVSFIGSTNDVDKYYSKADVLLLASRYEGFPRVLLEASLYGLPRVALRFTGIDDIITDTKNGYIFKQDEKDEIIAEQIIELLNNKELARKIGDAGAEHIKQFEEKIVMDRWVNLIKLVLNAENQDKINNYLKITNVRDNVFDIKLDSSFINLMKNIQTIIDTNNRKGIQNIVSGFYLYMQFYWQFKSEIWQKIKNKFYRKKIKYSIY